MNKVLSLAFVVCLLAACGGDDGEINARMLVSVEEVAAGSECAAGGQRVVGGLDLNGNGILDNREAEAPEHVCHAGEVRSLVTLSPEPGGEHCTVGGVRVDTGLDANHDGELGPAEMAQPRYLCTPAPAPGSLANSPTPPAIETTAPAVASSWITHYRTLITSDTELAYGVLADTPAGRMHFFPEGVTRFEQEATAHLSLGRSYSKLLMAVDALGNMTRKTITIESPETGIRLGRYAVSGTRLPAGFNCGGIDAESRFGALDGAVIDHVVLSSDRVGGWGVDWSQDGGYSLSVALAGLKIGHMRAIPLAATSTEWEHLIGTYMWGLSVVRVKARTKVAVLPNDPSRVNIGLTLVCERGSNTTVGTPVNLVATFQS